MDDFLIQAKKIALSLNIYNWQSKFRILNIDLVLINYKRLESI